MRQRRSVAKGFVLCSSKLANLLVAMFDCTSHAIIAIDTNAVGYPRQACQVEQLHSPHRELDVEPVARHVNTLAPATHHKIFICSTD